MFFIGRLSEYGCEGCLPSRNNTGGLSSPHICFDKFQWKGPGLFWALDMNLVMIVFANDY
jgi:hypothetical protein